MNKITTLEMELILARHFKIRRNLIVPNVSWGMFPYELDLVVLNSSDYATEIEIKITRADLKKDKQKKHNHNAYTIKNLYFAIPEYIGIDFALEHIPEKAGLLVISENTKSHKKYNPFIVNEIRKPISRKFPYKWNESDRLQLARLGALRIWGLKEKVINLKKGK